MAAAVHVRGAFVEGHEDDRVRERRAAGDLGQEGLEQVVTVGDRPVVHVVDHVRRDEVEVGGAGVEAREVA